MNMEDIIVINKTELKKKKEKILQAGHERLHILTDFDKTLTKAFVDGKKISSITAELRNGDYISKDYAEKAHALADKYHPIEIDPNVSLEVKKKAMQEWWSQHFRLLIASGLNKNHIEKIVDSGKVQFREGSLNLLDFLHKKNIPLVIISSAGLGGESIRMMLEKENKMYSNIYIVSNDYNWDSKGNAIGIKKPIIHVFNKDETIIKKFPFYDKIKNRKNVLLLGDSLGDLGMIKGFNYDNLIKIGFLNENAEENLKTFKDAYDVVLLNDGTMDFVNKLLEEIVK